MNASQSSMWKLAAAAAMACLAGVAQAQTFTQNTTITIPANGVGSVYPSTINVVGGPAAIDLSGFSVTVNFSHTEPRDVDMYLVSPTGDRIALMSDAGGALSFVGTLRFSAVGRLPVISEPLQTNIFYQPVDFDPGDVLPAPAPAGAYTASFSGLAGDNANGVWSLYVFDDTAANSGSITGWSLNFGGTVFGTQIPSTTTYQGVLRDSAGSLLTGTADITFRLYDSATSTAASDLIAGPITFNAVDLDDVNGSFTLNPDFGVAAYTSSTSKWIEIAVRSPAGAGAFTTLTPRQRLTASPVAQSSLRLASTDSSQLPAAEAVGTSVRVYGDLDVDGGQLDLRSGLNSFWTVDGDAINDFALRLRRQANADAVPESFTVVSIDDVSRRVNMNSGVTISRGAETPVTSPTVQITTGNDAELPASAGYLVLGPTTGENIVMDTNEIQARTNGVATDLALQFEGGFVGIGRFAAVNVLEVNGNASKSIAGGWLANSDRRIKQDVQPVSGALATLAKVKPVTFMYTPEYAMTHRGVEPSRRYFNVIAQEFAEAFPDAVKGSGEYLPGMDKNPAGEVLQVDTYPATITSIAAINELHELVRKQQAQIEELSKQVEELRKK